MKETVIISAEKDKSTNKLMFAAVSNASDYWVRNGCSNYIGWMLKTYNIEVELTVDEERLTGTHEDLMYFMMKWA